VGPPGSGTTTTLFAIMRGLDTYTNQIYTLGNLGSRKIFNTNAFEVNPEDDLATTLARVIRIEADVLLLDPIKAAETAKVLFSRAEDVAMISEFAAKDAANGVVQLLE